MLSLFNSTLFQNQFNKPCLLIGKGPSFSKIESITLSKYTTIALNHTIKKVKADIAHLIDFDVFESCQTDIEKNAKYLVLPWLPHINNKPGKSTLDTYLDKYAILKKLSNENRLFWYNLSTAKNELNGINPKGPIIPSGSFSASVVVNLLAALKVKRIVTLGIDGGNNYHSTFNELKDKTLLNNDWDSFNRQFREINKTISENNISYKSLAIESPIKVYVGSAQEQWLAYKVLAYSIQKYVSTSVVVRPLYENNISWDLPKDDKNKPRTPFSFQRFLIPELNKFKNKAIYLDSDMLVFTDIVDLWNRPMNDSDIFAAYKKDASNRLPQFSVMLLNCNQFKYSIKEIIKLLDDKKLTYSELMYEMKIAKKLKINIEPEWNSLEYYEKGVTKLIHYTDMHKQPWLTNTNQYAQLWINTLSEAIKDGFITHKNLNSEIIKGNVKPSLKYQVKFSSFDNTKLSILLKLLDKLYTPPHLRSRKKYVFQLLLNQISNVAHLAVYTIRLIPFISLSFIKKLNRKIRDNRKIRAIYYQLKSKYST